MRLQRTVQHQSTDCIQEQDKGVLKPRSNHVVTNKQTLLWAQQGTHIIRHVTQPGQPPHN